MSRRRKVNTRKILPCFHIVCGAEKTEKYYFQAHTATLGIRGGSVTVKVHTERGDPVGVVKAAMKLEAEPHDIVWVVLDKDDFMTFPDAYKLAKDNNIKIALSVICFEYWILLHFGRTERAFNTPRELIDVLKKQYPEYTKSCNGTYTRIKGEIDKAKVRAKSIRKGLARTSPRKKPYELGYYTNVDLLLDELNKFVKS